MLSSKGFVINSWQIKKVNIILYLMTMNNFLTYEHAVEKMSKSSYLQCCVQLTHKM